MSKIHPLTESIAKKIGREACEHYIKTGEFDAAVKLTDEEMAHVKGGELKRGLKEFLGEYDPFTLVHWPTTFPK